jgi:hypothetical protein
VTPHPAADPRFDVVPTLIPALILCGSSYISALRPFG